MLIYHLNLMVTIKKEVGFYLLNWYSCLFCVEICQNIYKRCILRLCRGTFV